MLDGCFFPLLAGEGRACPVIFWTGVRSGVVAGKIVLTKVIKLLKLNTWRLFTSAIR